MITDNHINNLIDKRLREENDRERSRHISSGKLSASRLGDPLQWQILNSLGAETAEIDSYTLRKFRRGKDVEAWMCEQLNPLDSQIAVSYRDVVGVVDALVDTKDWEFPNGVIPVEIKSVTNTKYKRINQRKEPDEGHLLQAGLYGLALKSEYFAVAYVSTDDYRTWMFMEKTEMFREKIDAIIEAYNKQLSLREVPVFVPRESWQSNVKYNRFPDWSMLDSDSIRQKLSELNLSFK